MIDREDLLLKVSIGAVDINTAKAILALQKQLASVNANIKKMGDASSAYMNQRKSQVDRLIKVEQGLQNVIKSQKIEADKLIATQRSLSVSTNELKATTEGIIASQKRQKQIQKEITTIKANAAIAEEKLRASYYQTEAAMQAYIATTDKKKISLKEIGIYERQLMGIDNEMNILLKTTADRVMYLNGVYDMYSGQLIKLREEKSALIATISELNAQEKLSTQATKQLAQSEQKLAVVDERIVALNTEMAATQGMMNNKMVAANKDAGALGMRLGQYENQLNRVNVNLKKTSNIMAAAGKETFMSTFHTLRRIVTTMVALSSIYWFKSLIEGGMEFENSMIKIAAITKATNTEFEQLSYGLRKLARESVFTINEVTEVAMILGQAGFTTAQILETTAPILGFAAATMSSLTTATELVIGVLKTYNLQMSEAAGITNILTEAAIESTATVEDLQTAFGYAGPAGYAFNQTIETVIATLGTLKNMGLEASTTGTVLRYALIELASGSAREIKVLQKLGLSLEQVSPEFRQFGDIIKTLARTSISSAEAIQLFGTRAGTAMFSLIKKVREGGESINDMAKRLSAAKDMQIVDSIYKKVLTSVRSQFMLTKAEMQDMGITLFQVFKPALVEIVTKVRDGFRNFNEEMKRKEGKDFSQLLLDMIPLFSAVGAVLHKLMQIFMIFVNVIVFLQKYIKVVEGAIYMLSAAIVLCSMRSLLASNAVKALGGSLVWVGERFIQLITFTKAGTFSLSALRISFNLTNIAAKALRFTLGTLVTGGAMLAFSFLPEIIDAIASALGFATKKADENADSMNNVAESIGFATEEMQKYSEQTKLNIDSQQKYNDLLKQSQIIISNGRAVRLSQPALNPYVTTPRAEPALPTYKQEISNLENTVNKVQDITDEIAGLTIKAQKSLENIKLKDITEDDKAFGDSLHQVTQSLEGLLNISQDQAAEMMSRMFKDMGTEFTEAFNNTAKFNELYEKIRSSGGFQFINKDESVELKAMINDMINLQQGMIAARGETIIEAQKDIGSITSQMNKAEKLIEARKVAQQEILNIQSQEAQGELTSAESKERIVKLVQEELNINGNLIGISNDLNNLEAEYIKKVQEAGGQYTKQGYALQLIVDVVRNTKEQLQDMNDTLNDIIDKYNTISREIELAQLMTEKAIAEIRLQNLEQANLNAKIKDQKQYYDLVNISYRKFFKTLMESGSEITDIGTKFDIMQDKIKLSEIMNKSRDIMREIAEGNLQKQIITWDEKIRVKKQEIDTLTNSISKESLKTYKEDRKKQLIEETTRDIKQSEADIEEMATKRMQIDLNLQNKKLELLQIELEIRNRIKDDVEFIGEQQDKIILSDMGKNIKDINKQYDTRLGLMQNTYETVSAKYDLEMDKRPEERNRAAMEEQLSQMEKLEKSQKDIIWLKEVAINELYKEIELQARLNNLQAITGFGTGEEAVSLEQERLARDKRMNDIANTDFSKLSFYAQKQMEHEYETLNLLQNGLNAGVDEGFTKWQNTLRVVGNIGKAFGYIFEGIHADIEAAGSFSAVMEQIGQSIGGFVNDLKSIATDAIVDNLIAPLIDQMLGLESESEKILDKYNDAVAEANKEYAKKVAEIWKKYRDDMYAAEKEHLEKLNEIRIRFDDMRRDKENEIYNERVERLMSLAKLEEELRNKGLTDEQQRAQLQMEIDQALASSRLGTIEERQIKLAAIEEQVKALNDLENRLGYTRTEIENSSIARLNDLRKATSDFYTDKRNDAVATIEAERTAEIQSETQRYADERNKIRQERDDALREAAQDRANAIADAMADYNEAMQKEGDWKAKLGDALKGLAKGLVSAGISALLAVLLNKGGEVKRLNRATGGLITGGHGGIDDIHASLPEHAFVVNRRATMSHINELNAMTSSGMASYRNTVPVGLTSGEYAVLPPASIRYHNRLMAINNGTADRNVTGYASGGSVRGSSTPVTIVVNTTFSGVNMVSGESEAAVSEFYNKHLGPKIQRDINNKKINLGR